MQDYMTKCPNCGAPLTKYGKCEYCGTTIHQPFQILTVPFDANAKRYICKAQIPLFIGEKDPEMAAEYMKRDIREKMADALIDSIKFVTRREFDPMRFEEIITVRGELWVQDSNAYY